MSGWLKATTACPGCGERNVLEVREVFRVQPIGTFSLAGAQTKFPARDGWEYRCTRCAATGASEPKHPYGDSDLAQARAYTEASARASTPDQQNPEEDRS